MQRRSRLASVAAMFAVFGLLLSACTSGLVRTYPEGPIEFVVSFAPGGGSDNLARHIVKAIETEKLVSQPINIVHKAGGAGSIGHNYVSQKKGDSHVIATVIDSIVSVPLGDEYTGATWRDLTLYGLLARDDFYLTVNAKSKWNTIEELIANAKANPGKITLGTAAHGGEDHIFGALVEKATGAKWNFVHFTGGGPAMQALVGGHIDVAVPNPSEFLAQFQGGLVRPLAVGSAKRLAILPDVPTLKEKGFDVEFQMFRGVAGPPGVPADVQRFWADVLKKVSESEFWQKEYIGKLGLTPQYQPPEEMAKTVAATEEIYKKTLLELGVIKGKKS